MFAERLAKISDRLDRARVVSLVARDGIAVETHGGTEEFDLEGLTAELMAQVHSINDGHRELDLGPVRQFTVSTDSMTAMLGRLTQDYFLMLILGTGASQGRARFELRRAPLAFEDDL